MAPLEVSRRSFVAAGSAAALTMTALASSRGAFASTAAAATLDVVTPLPQLQQDFVDMRFGMFLHFSLGTFTDEEWAAPNQPPSAFAPTDVDCAQWAAAAKAAKMEYGVLTTKHHDGFSLWPTSQGTQNVMSSGYKQDIVRKYVDAFRAEGLKIGFYFSIWDRTADIQGFGGHVDDPSKSIEPAHMDLILAQLTELLTDYGPIDLIMTDGYTWQMGSQALNYARIRQHVKDLQPNCLLTDICAVTEPWLGDLIFWEEPLGVRVPAGNTHAGLQGQTISNGWFWHPSVPREGLMSTSDIVSHLNETEPNYTSFILNCPPNRNGRLDDNVVARLAEVGAAWSGPNTSRPPLPDQGTKVQWPIIPVAAFATQFNTNYGGYESPYKAIDGRGDLRFETCWSTWAPDTANSLPATITVDLGGLWSGVTTFEYLPKQWNRNELTDGDVRRAKLWFSTDGVTWDEVTDVQWPGGKAPKGVTFSARDAAYLKFDVLEASGGYVNVNGLKVGSTDVRPVLKQPRVTAAKVQLLDARSGRALTSTGDGVTLAQPRAGASDWRLVAAEDNYWHLENVQTALALSLSGTARTAGAETELDPKLRAYGQQWALTQLGADSWVLTNRFNMLSLSAEAVPGASVSLQDPSVTSDALRWRVVPVDVPVPSIVLDSGTVQAGSTLTVTGSAFTAGDAVSLSLVSTATTARVAALAASPLGGGIVDNTGGFSVTVTIPSGTDAGSYTVQADAAPSGDSAQTALTVSARDVTATPTPTPTGTPSPTGSPSGTPFPTGSPTGSPAPASGAGGSAVPPGGRGPSGPLGALAATGDPGAEARVVQGVVAGAAAVVGGSLILRERRRRKAAMAAADAAEPLSEDRPTVT